MQKESEKYETPDEYAKYGKMQRQILKLEKELKKLKVLADESQKRPAQPDEEESEDEPEPAIEEAKNTEGSQTTQQVASLDQGSSYWLVKLHLFASIVFMIVAYVIPLTFTSYLFSSEAKQSIHTNVDHQQLGVFLGNRIFTTVDYHGMMHTFLGFRVTYMLCLWVSGVLINMVTEFLDEMKKPRPGSKKSK